MKKADSVVMLKAVVVLCCMICLISFLVGGLAIYLYLQTTKTIEVIYRDVEKEEQEVVKKKCFGLVYYEILEKTDATNQEGNAKYAVARSFQSDPVLLVVPNVIYDTLETGSTYEMKVYYNAESEKDDFLTADKKYQISSASLTDKTGLDLASSVTCE